MVNLHPLKSLILAVGIMNGCQCEDEPAGPTVVPEVEDQEPIDWNNFYDSGTPTANPPSLDAGGPGDAVASGRPDGGVTLMDAGVTDDDVCVALSATANNVVLPVDIIWVIDSSPSMDDSILIIEQELNLFVAEISESNLDYRVVLVGADDDYYDPAAQKQYLGICIPEPLSGAAGCPDTDSESYRHIRQGVHSHDALSKLINNYEDYKDFLRPDAITHFIAVSDDDTGGYSDDEDFESFIATATAPGFPQGFVFHSIVDLIGYIEGCFWDDSCSCGENRGQEYINMSEDTGGVIQSICQEDWTEVFDALQENVVQGALLPCEYLLPELENNLQIEADETNVVLISTEDGSRTTLPNVQNGSQCGDNEAWYFDNANHPTRAILCEAACGLINTTIELEFGCETVKYPQQ